MEIPSRGRFLVCGALCLILLGHKIPLLHLFCSASLEISRLTDLLAFPSWLLPLRNGTCCAIKFTITPSFSTNLERGTVVLWPQFETMTNIQNRL
jgi:hypothetical protein